MAGGKLSNDYVSSFCLEMSLLMHAGIGTEDGLYLLMEDEEDVSVKKMLRSMADKVADGYSFSTAIRETGRFPKYVSDMLETGEQTGRQEQSFRSLSDYYDRQNQLANQVRSALLYPSILLVLMLIILVVLLVKVLPVFNQVYEQLGGTLGTTAGMLLSLGQWIDRCMPVFCIVIGMLVVVGALLAAVPALRHFIIEKYKVVFGDTGITKQLSEAQFAAAMSMGMRSGLNTEEAFRTAMLFHSSTKKAEKRYEKCLEMLEMGEPLAECFKQNKILDVVYCRILELGAKSGTSDTAMEEIARRMDDSVQMAIQRKVGRIEPTIVIITSLLVGVVLIAVMLPLINIMSSIG